MQKQGDHPGRRERFFSPSPPFGAALIASTTAPRPQSAFLSTSFSCLVVVVEGILNGVDSRAAPECSTTNALRATLRPREPSNNASISSSTTATLRLRFLRSFPLGASATAVPLVVLASGTGAGAAEVGVESEVDEATMPEAEANTDGVACKRRHSSGLRCNNDKPSPRVKVRANCELARRAV